MKIKRTAFRLAATGMVTIMVALLFGHSSAQAQDVEFVMIPDMNTVQIGSSFTVIVQIRTGTQPINTAVTMLAVDPDVLQIDSVTPTTTPLDFGLLGMGNDLEDYYTFDTDAGTVEYQGGTIGGSASGTFTLFTVEFTALAVGDTMVQFVQPSTVYGAIVYPVAITNSNVTVVDQTVAITLGWFLAEPADDAVNFRWQTVTESNTAGFNILAEVDAELIQVNDDLIPSKVIDSVEPTDYEFSATVEATRFLLQEIELSGRVSDSGPFELGHEYGFLVDDPIDWADDTHLIYLPAVIAR